MILANSFENLTFYLFPILLSLIFTTFGSIWINWLYLQEQDITLLSFPDKIASRAIIRKPVLFLLLVLCIGKALISLPLPFLLYYVVAITLLSFITMTDFEQYVIFDSMLLPLAITGLCYTLHLRLSLLEHLAAGLGGGLLFLLLAVVSNGAIGGGDIKLIAAMGLWFGPLHLLSVIAYGFMAGGVAALFLLLTKQKKRQDYFAYGPYFALSGIAILLGWLRVLF